jgi:two-component system, response regulator
MMNKFDSIEVLIVEDNPSDAELAERILTKYHLSDAIYSVEDGREALDFIFCEGRYASRTPAIPLKAVFLDIKIPKVSGLDVLREIKSRPETKELPVIMLTASDEDPDISSAYELGANSYVLKPVDFTAFVSALEKTGLFWLLKNATQEE